MESQIQNLKSKIPNIPKNPGVYEFLDKDDEVLYVGKAKNLRSRVGQYFGKTDGRPQIPFLMQEAVNFDYTVVNNELESLYLENTLIKQYRPKYNILLRDDKNYAFIKIDYSTQIPQIGYARKIDQKSEIPSARRTKSAKNLKSKILNPKSLYFGPYTAAYKIRNTLNLVRKIFPFCSATKIGSRPCFYYYLHRCPGVCIGKITLKEYIGQLNKIAEFLNGDVSGIIKSLRKEMAVAAKIKKFEAAGRLRDQLRALQLLQEKQTVILTKKVDWDIVSLAQSDGYTCVNLFKIREGKMFDKENFVYETSAENLPGEINFQHSQILETYLTNYYLETGVAPSHIYLEAPVSPQSAVKQLIQNRFNKTVKIIVPKKGKLKNLIRLGQTNAGEYLKNWLNDQAGNLDKINASLDELKKVLNLPQRPGRIECYDISNIQGSLAVGSMVVFEKGLPKKSEYKKFKIRLKSTPDDFAMMKEMLERRVSKIKNNQSQKDAWTAPDLIVIDGGKGQLSAALEVLTTYNLQLTTPVVGLAKRIEEIFVPGLQDPIILPRDNPALLLLQRLRDEAHRFGITYHRLLRSKQAVKSALDSIPGVGPKTKKLLKQKFGTVASIKKTKFDDLAEVVGKKIAQLIQHYL